MNNKVKRKIIHIDEAKCNGCGNCIDSCVEGALALVDGKARLVKESYCDGLAACLKECPQGALSIEEREADSFDEEEAALNAGSRNCEKGTPLVCPGSAVTQFEKSSPVIQDSGPQPSNLGHWPVQLSLISPGAPFLIGAHVLLIAHCVPLAYPALHRDFLADRAVMIACPKLDDAEAHLARFTDILRETDIRSLTVLRMQVPCCSGLTRLANLALTRSGRQIPLHESVIGIKGEIVSQN